MIQYETSSLTFKRFTRPPCLAHLRIIVSQANNILKLRRNIMAEQSNHAIVFGASGLLGWAVANQLLSAYPHVGAFSKVTVALNRPVPESELYFPGPSPSRPELQIASGVNLLSGTGEDLAKQLKEKVAGAETITHVFYNGTLTLLFHCDFIANRPFCPDTQLTATVFAPFNDDHIRECKQNSDMMQRIVDAMNIVAPKLKSVVYAGGSRVRVHGPYLVRISITSRLGLRHLHSWGNIHSATHRVYGRRAP